MLNKELKKLNLKDKEASIYLALLELGEANMQRICDKAAVKRTTAYEVLNALREKGLISVAKKHKKTLYLAESPYKIGEIIDNEKITFTKILPQLLSITNSLDKKPQLKFFEGKNGLREVYNDTLKYPNTEITGWASSEAIKNFDSLWVLNDYVERRLKNKIWARVIATDDEVMRAYQKEEKDLKRQTLLIPKEKYPLNIEINLYGNASIAIISFKEEIALIIESKKIMQTFKSIFEMNWDMFKKV